MPKVSRAVSSVIFYVAGYIAMPMMALLLLTVLIYAVLMTLGFLKKRRLGVLELVSMNPNFL